MAQLSNLKTVKLSTVMNRKAFVIGFKDAKSGKPFNYDYSQFTKEQWDYERGRIFGFYYKGASIKDGRRVRWDAIDACHRAFSEGVIF